MKFHRFHNCPRLTEAQRCFPDDPLYFIIHRKNTEIICIADPDIFQRLLHELSEISFFTEYAVRIPRIVIRHVFQHHGTVFYRLCNCAVKTVRMGRSPTIGPVDTRNRTDGRFEAEAAAPGCGDPDRSSPVRPLADQDHAVCNCGSTAAGRAA